MSKEKVIEIKINDVTYIVSEVNRNDDHLKQIIKDENFYSFKSSSRETIWYPLEVM